MAVRSRPITEFRIGRGEPSFGTLTFVGGLELVSRHPLFGSFSAFRFTEPGTRFAGVTDNGYWYFGRIERDAQKRPTGMTDFTMEPMTGPDGEITQDKRLVDAESLAIADGIATVGFERQHRISQYRLETGTMGKQIRNLDFLIPKTELRINRGFETVMAAPQSGPFAGAIIALSEMSLNKRGDIFASVLSGPRKGIFFVHRSNNFDITDGAFLPDGDILILERRFAYTSGIAMRLRRLSAASIKPGATVDGEVLLEADMGYQIDNMEGMDIWQAADGTTRVSLISDDNQSILQRNIYLEFIYKAE
ncbi:esterase-like activity of phytase family protein [Tianweitania sp. BSSL-BM11]|uniref:Esterase-like activity of phytase family protein n=2 Tax=Tianweitania aestuarii TaxID=2814886 RepID=A0ABS5RZ86_9HYPH|nr:esterase-like activity of phytase family protein [Tianweitania aestuarii]MBS9722338.1 esterase-like activity of phytase family protein [Tianweitania aestuarii]